MSSKSRPKNEMYIGRTKLDMSGRTIKHPALINFGANVNASKSQEKMVKLIGIDIETEKDTGEMRLLGFYDDKGYSGYDSNLLAVLFTYIKRCADKNVNMAHWNRLDPFQLFRLLIIAAKVKDYHVSCKRWGKVSGEWDKKNQCWIMKPVLEIVTNQFTFGIRNVIRSSIQFFYYENKDRILKTCWAFDVAGFYKGGIEKSAKAFGLNFYTKMGKEYHIVDWNRYATDVTFKKNVRLSNELDARAARELGFKIQEFFHYIFKEYPRNLISQGALARSGIAITIKQDNKSKGYTGEELNEKVHDDLTAIGITRHIDNWMNTHGQELTKDIYCLFSEAYSGGNIDAIRYGYAPSGYYADLAGAYSATTVKLPDLRHSKIEKGTGDVIQGKNEYVVFRGTCHIPESIKFHSITIKHPLYRDTNIRPTGDFKAAYTYEERAFIIERGGSFSDEEWFKITTTGELSPLSNVITKMYAERMRLLKEDHPAEYMPKIVMASAYGITFEAVDTYIETEITKETKIDTGLSTKELIKPYRKNIDLTDLKDEFKHLFDNHYASFISNWHNASSGNDIELVKAELADKGIILQSDHPVDIMLELDQLYRNSDKYVTETHQEIDIIRNGYRSGEFWNPFYAMLITAETRLSLAKAATAIEDAGGEVIVLMTDSITWSGNATDLPVDMIREKKTLGYFEPPVPVTDIVCLGSGRYGFKTEDQKLIQKRRGLNIVALDDNTEVEFNWLDLLKQMAELDTLKLDVKVRMLISPQIIANWREYGINDLGRIVDDVRNVPMVVGKTKREFDRSILSPKVLATQLIPTKPIHLFSGFYGKVDTHDGTLPELRQEVMQKKIRTKKQRKQAFQKKRSKKFYEKNGDSIKEIKKTKYQYMAKRGIPAETCKKLCTSDWDAIKYEVERKEWKD